jgi:hypothetical protein
MKLEIGLGIIMLSMLVGLSFAGLNGPAPIPAPPAFSIHTNLTTLCKGLTNFIPITVVNSGGSTVGSGIGPSNVTVVGGTTMTAIQLSIGGADKTLLPEGNGTITVGSLGPHNSITAYMPVFVSNNATLLTTMEVGVSYYYLQLYGDTEVRNLTFEAETCGSPISVDVTPKTVSSGQIQNLSINMTNSGNTQLNAIYVHYDVPNLDGAIIGSTETEIRSLAPGATYHIRTSLFVSRNASIESFPFNVTATFYNSSNIEQVVNSTPLVPVGAISMQTSGVTLSPTITTPGGIFSISFILTDIGTSGASAVTVDALPDGNFSAFGTNPVYVGDISADQQAPVTVTLTTNSLAKDGTYSVPLKINYLNSLRQNVTQDMNVSVIVGSGLSSSGTGALNSSKGVTYKLGSSLGGLLLIIFLLVIIGALGYLYYGERTKNKRRTRSTPPNDNFRREG